MRVKKDIDATHDDFSLYSLGNRTAGPHECFEHRLDFKVRKTLMRGENREAIAARTPDGGIRFSPQCQAAQPDGSGEVRNSRVVTDEEVALLKPDGQINKRQALSDVETRRRDKPGETIETLTLSFATHEEKVPSGRSHQPAEQLDPLGLRPVLVLTPTTGM